MTSPPDRLPVRVRPPDPTRLRRVPEPSGATAEVLDHPLRLRTGGRPVLTLEPAAVRLVASACRTLVTAMRVRPVTGERHGDVTGAEVLAAVRRVLADMSTARPVELDRSALREWSLVVGTLRRLVADHVGGATSPRTAVLRYMHEQLVQAREPEPLRAESTASEPAACRCPSRPVRASFGLAVAVALTVTMITLVGMSEPAGLEPEQPTVGAVAASGQARQAAAAAVGSPKSSPLHDPRLHVSATTCTLPEMGTTNAAVEEWVQAAVTCLDAVWQPVLSAAGVRHRRPVVFRYRDQVSTRCTGELRTNGFYCAVDEVIGVSPSHELAQVPVAARPAWLLAVLAHEYGHHVQELAGVSPAADAARQGHQPGDPAWLESSRRTELQANCLAGVAIASMSGRGSVGPGEVVTARLSVSGGDDVLPGRARDHGTSAHNQQWFVRGLESGSPSACNTWVAQVADVD